MLTNGRCRKRHSPPTSEIPERRNGQNCSATVKKGLPRLSLPSGFSTGVEAEEDELRRLRTIYSRSVGSASSGHAHPPPLSILVAEFARIWMRMFVL